jgi:methionine synthase II (cobalamin-independent)
MHVDLPAAAVTGIGSLPHLDPRAAAELVLERLPDLPFIPSLPRRSPAEGMLAQVVVGVRGITVDEDGDLVVDHRRLDPIVTIVPDLDHDAYVGLRTFLDVAREHRGLVKWQLTGPITLGLALYHKGVRASVAFDVAIRAVRVHLRAVHRAVSEALPHCRQVVVLDEPGLTTLLGPELPLPVDTAIDFVSGALAAVESTALVGVHCCGGGDLAAILAAGPGLLSVPVEPGLVGVAGYLAAFLEAGGWIAWGAVPTDRPVGSSPDRHWHALAELWCELVQAGCHPVRLREQAVITPACGLGLHQEDQAERVLDLAGQVAERVRAQAVATRLSIGA